MSDLLVPVKLVGNTRCCLLFLLLCSMLTRSTGAADFPAFSITLQDMENNNGLVKLLNQTISEHRDNLMELDVEMGESILLRQEMDLLAKTMNAEGYYDHRLEYLSVNGVLNYSIRAGRQFRISYVMVNSDQEDISIPAIETLGLRPDLPLLAQSVITAEENLERYLRENNCLWQNTVSHEVRLIRETAQGSVHFHVLPSPQVTLASVSFRGLDSIDEEFIRESLNLAAGQCYRVTEIEKSRLKLLQSGLFTLVDTDIQPPENGMVDVIFDLKERHHKTIKAGIGYSTDESISITGGWQHRNFLGSGELLDIEARGSKLYRTIESTLSIPSFYSPKQVLVLEAELNDENLEAYEATGLSTMVTLRRSLAQHLTGSVGIRYQFRSVTEDNDDTLFGLASLPLALEYDSRDDLLDPRKGWVASLKVQPVLGTLDTDILFLKSSLGSSIYHTFPDITFTPTLAARALIGSIVGNPTDTIPADERFYGGGGGSVRGYPFQMLGTVVNGEPSGGRSLLEFSLEARLHFTEQWGGVVFIDGGNVYDSRLPEFDRGVQWAVGVGARYTTGLAPVRLDIAFPVNRRDHIDDSFQIYISLAQAF